MSNDLITLNYAASGTLFAWFTMTRYDDLETNIIVEAENAYNVEEETAANSPWGSLCSVENNSSNFLHLKSLCFAFPYFYVVHSFCLSSLSC